MASGFLRKVRSGIKHEVLCKDLTKAKIEKALIEKRSKKISSSLTRRLNKKMKSQKPRQQLAKTQKPLYIGLEDNKAREVKDCYLSCIGSKKYTNARTRLKVSACACLYGKPVESRYRSVGKSLIESPNIL